MVFYISSNMDAKNTRFDAVVIAAVGIVLGTTYLLRAMLALLSTGGEGPLLLANSVAVTIVAGVLLSLAAGLLVTGQSYGRYLGAVAFGAVAVFGRPSMTTPHLLEVAQAGLALIAAAYLVLLNPVPERERSSIDESTSAAKVGSTIR